MDATHEAWSDLAKHIRSWHSQCGEEGVLVRIFELIGTTTKAAVEFGGGDGSSLSNTRYFEQLGWRIVMFDNSNESQGVHREHVTAENINGLLKKYDALDLDLLSIDIDGNDYWVWKAIESKPRVVIIEYNTALGQEESKTVPYNPEFRHDGTDYYGASLKLLKQLGLEKGYTLVHQVSDLNAIFVRSELLPEGLSPMVSWIRKQNHPHDQLDRPWQVIDS